MKKPKATIGDVFRIPIDDARCAYGQVFYKNHVTFPLYVAVFRPGFPRDTPIPLETIVSSELALVGATMDARIYHGIWQIVGNRKPDMSRLPRPNFRVVREGKTVIEDFDGNVQRSAAASDMKKYDNRWSCGPMGFELAIKAIHGVGEWREAYEELTFQHAVEQST